MSRPRLLDLYCCEGGAAAGYYCAGFDVYGVDLFEDYSQKRYPFPSWRGDALGELRALSVGSSMTPLPERYGELLYLRDFDAIHASPPCQRHSAGTRASDRSKYPDLIGPTRELLKSTGLPYVIENVPGAPLEDPVTLCWTMFHQPGSVLDEDGTPLQMFRHRLFETNWELTAPECKHDPDMQVAGSYGGARRDKREAREIRHGGYVPSIPVQRELLGVNWMTQKGMFQCIPPSYTEHVGAQLLDMLREEAA
ncbi:MAG TPA: hypothetical protein VFH56_14290 [Acidimicrobiales bacterium]|nr:hypothetical protein [Acidimicrobiales bacterium]